LFTSAPAPPGAVGAAEDVASATGAAEFVTEVTRTYSTVSLVVVPGVTTSRSRSGRWKTSRPTCRPRKSFGPGAPAEVSEPPVTRDLKPTISDWMRCFAPNCPPLGACAEQGLVLGGVGELLTERLGLVRQVEAGSGLPLAVLVGLGVERDVVAELGEGGAQLVVALALLDRGLRGGGLGHVLAQVPRPRPP
jgi:hypothetical protein